MTRGRERDAGVTTIRARPTSSLLAALLSVGLLYVLCLGLFVPQFQTNDDAAMAMIAAGFELSDSGTEHLLFTHVAIGLVLQRLYAAWPEFPWYGTYLHLLQFLAFTLLGFCLLRVAGPRPGALLWLAWLATFGSAAVISLQFTQVSALLAGAGLFACLSVCDWPPGPRAERILVGLAGALGACRRISLRAE